MQRSRSAAAAFSAEVADRLASSRGERRAVRHRHTEALAREELRAKVARLEQLRAEQEMKRECEQVAAMHADVEVAARFC